MIGRETVISEDSDKRRRERFVTLLGPAALARRPLPPLLAAPPPYAQRG
jgi:hypothetical protein